jgi:rhodanese-related sulfurtransferase
MTTRNQATGKPLRISVADLQARLQAGEAASMFDVRNQSQWDRSDRKIPGALRPQGREIGLDPAWSKDRLLVAY